MNTHTHTLNLIGGHPVNRPPIDMSSDESFYARRNNSGSGNTRDIEATLFGSEIANGLGYHDKRVFILDTPWNEPSGPSEAFKAEMKAYWQDRALSGKITDAEIECIFPRIKRRSELSTDADNERRSELYNTRH